MKLYNTMTRKKEEFVPLEEGKVKMYVCGPTVYNFIHFRTRSFKDYGKLSHKNLDDLKSGGRELLVSGQDEKEDPLDFVLWKPKKDGEPYWDAPWSKGRPGWHIECSEMSRKYRADRYPCRRGRSDFPASRK